jgi:hypothetical protein
MGNMTGRLMTVDDVIAFATAGNATLTLVSVKSGARFTYKIRKPAEAKGPVAFFVSLMNGPDNESSFSYLGHVYNNAAGLRYQHGKKSKIGASSASALAFAWFWQHVVAQKQFPDTLEIWHSGSCGRCGRKLTVPSSISSGFGPECVKHIGKMAA